MVGADTGGGAPGGSAENAVPGQIRWRTWRNAGRPGLCRARVDSLDRRPPSGPGWLHEIIYDGFRITARRDGASVRPITRHGNDFTTRFPLVAATAAMLPARSFLIDVDAYGFDVD
jgi:bifunctional non-homologous end joining protein LigD